MRRILSQETKIPVGRIRRGEIKDHEWPSINEAAAKISAADLFISDEIALTVGAIQKGIVDVVSNKEVNLVIIDYLCRLLGSIKHVLNLSMASWLS